MELMPKSWERNPFLKVLGWVMLVLGGPIILIAHIIFPPRNRKPSPQAPHEPVV
jgi:hypothetical protein